MLAGDVVDLAQFQSAGCCSVLTDDREHARAGTGGTPRTLNLQLRDGCFSVPPSACLVIHVIEGKRGPSAEGGGRREEGWQV